MSDFDFAEVLTRMVQMRASDVHLTPGFPPAVRVRGRIVPDGRLPPLSPQETREIVYSILNDYQRSGSRTSSSSTSPTRSRTWPGSASTASSSAARSAPPSATSRTEIQSLESLGPAAGARGVHPQAARLRPRHRSDRLRQVDHARVDDRRDQRRARGAHPHDRGPDRVPAPAQASASSTSARSAPTRTTSRSR